MVYGNDKMHSVGHKPLEILPTVYEEEENECYGVEEDMGEDIAGLIDEYVQNAFFVRPVLIY